MSNLKMYFIFILIIYKKIDLDDLPTFDLSNKFCNFFTLTQHTLQCHCCAYTGLSFTYLVRGVYFPVIGITRTDVSNRVVYKSDLGFRRKELKRSVIELGSFFFST